MISLFHLDNILIRPDLLPLCFKARQASWGLTFVPVIKYNEAGGGEFERARNPICLWRSLSAFFPSFPIHTVLSRSSVRWHISCPSLSWSHRHVALGCQCLQSMEPVAAQRGCSTHPCALFSFAESDFPPFKNYGKEAQAEPKLSMTRTIRISPVNWG